MAAESVVRRFADRLDEDLLQRFPEMSKSERTLLVLWIANDFFGDDQQISFAEFCSFMRRDQWLKDEKLLSFLREIEVNA